MCLVMQSEYQKMKKKHLTHDVYILFCFFELTFQLITQQNIKDIFQYGGN